MNHQEVLTALNTAIDPESEVYNRVWHQYSSLTPDWADQARAHDLAPAVADVLRRQPEYVRYPAMAIRHDLGIRPFDPNVAAERLVLRAMKDGIESAINWLADILEKPSAVGMRVMPIWQLAVDETLTLSHGVKLIPFSELPHSLAKSWLEQPYDQTVAWMLPAPLNFEAPTAVITARTVIDPLFINVWEYQPKTDETSDLLNDIRLCLSAIGPYPLLGPMQWFQFEDPQLDAVASTGAGSNRLEILPHSLPPPLVLDRDAAQKLIPKFIALPKQVRVRVRISLQRLVQAMLRREPGDKAADLSIALEALLTDGRGEHTWKVSTRAAVLTGWNLRSMLDRRSVISAAYDMRSSLVYSGAAANKVRVSGKGRQPAVSVCEQATQICAGVIRAIIERGAIPDWAAFDVSGGLCGWPRTGLPAEGPGG